MFDVITTLSLHHALVLIHVFGLVLGFGLALSIDYLVLRSLLSACISPIVIDMAVQASRLTSAGLAMLWLTGIAFLAEYSLESPEKLNNPKIYAKVVIVTLLTLNGWLIHRCVMPVLWRCAGGALLRQINSREMALFAACAAVSTVSWVFPVIFGLNPALNFQYSVLHLLGQYLLCCALLAALIGVVMWLAQRRLQRAGDDPGRLLQA